MLDIADRRWARDFACPPGEVRPSSTHVQEHAGALTGDSGIWILVTGAFPRVSIPPSVMAELGPRASQWSAEVVANGAALNEELRHLNVAAIIGPAFIGYGTAATLDLSRAAEARELTSTHRDAVAGLRAACSHEDWRHGGSEHGEVPTFGSFNAGGELCAVAGYKTWDGAIAHLAIVCAPGRRGGGFATAAVAAAARHALSAGLIPQYRTLLSNEPSMRIAARLGFERYGFSVYVRLEDPRAALHVTHETYTHGHARATVLQHGRRTADEAAAFLLPELKPGMRLLDVGCGPGSITRGLAERLAPGEVVGVDLSAETLASARQDAAARGIANLRYEEGSVYDLPFADASFDVVFAHQVLQHLREPSAAIREMLRVLRPGGLIAVRDVDWGTAAYWPSDPWIDRFIEVHVKTWCQNGGDPRMGRKLRALLNGSNVTELQITGSQWCYASPADTREWGESYAERLLTSPMGSRAVERGNASREDLEAMAAAFRAWASHPDAFWAFIHVAALARKAG